MPCLSLTFPSWLNPIGQCCSLSRHHTSNHTAQISPGLSVSRGDTTARPQAKTIKSNQQIGRSFGAADNPSDSQLDGKFPLPRSEFYLKLFIFACAASTCGNPSRRRAKQEHVDGNPHLCRVSLEQLMVSRLLSCLMPLIAFPFETSGLAKHTLTCSQRTQSVIVHFL